MSPENIRVPHNCHQCDSIWVYGDPSNYQAVTMPQLNFVNAIGQIRKQLEKNGGGAFRILLEFDESEG